MRSRSWRFFDTASVTSSKHVLFGAQSIANIRILSIHRSSTLKFLKYFWTHSFLNFGQPHGVIISVQPIKGRAEKWREIYFSQYFLLFVLKACVLHVCASLRLEMHACRHVLKACVPCASVAWSTSKQEQDCLNAGLQNKPKKIQLGLLILQCLAPSNNWTAKEWRRRATTI